MTTTYDLSYNILPKGLEEPKIRTYHPRKRKWIPEQDLTRNYGNLTNFGLKEAINKDLYENSKEGLAKNRWNTIYREEISQLAGINITPNTQFNRRTVNFNVPDLTHFKCNLLNMEPCLLPFKVKNLKEDLKLKCGNAIYI
ncbi:uncharacterized protein LOC116429608 [Nomia melanderi]|uniref:uncharacterized protein LOC116429608 n=1 Tax=Nomia melanderi TaxID=2448451 RepID=UPI003FCDEE62